MLRRTLILTLTLAALVAVTGVGGASAKPSEKFKFTLPPITPFTQDPIDIACKIKLDSDGKTVEIFCNNTGGGPTNNVNPHPPKDEKIFKLPVAVDKGIGSLHGIRLWIKLWPSGAVTASIYVTDL